jgi:hypothetical protein
MKMKNTLKGLGLEITNKKIIVRDTTGITKYEQTFILTGANKMQMLQEAKSWLWNMGNFNGQAIDLINKFNIKWVKELNK